MFTHNFIYISSGIVISLILCISRANGITNKPYNHCVEYNNDCDPHSPRPCCNSTLSCKIKKSRKEFVCGEKGEIGASCVTDEDCWEISHAKCSTEKKCVCRANNFRLNETYCAPKLGGFCWKNEPCVTINALCIGNECQCKKNYSVRDDECLPVLVGSYCIDDKSCSKIKFAKCSKTNECFCTNNTSVVNNSSCEPVLDSYCATDVDCLVIDSVCKDNKCKCAPGRVALNDNQCELPHLGVFCFNDDTCKVLINNSICNEKKMCVCDQHSYPVKRVSYISSMDTSNPPRDECRIKNSHCFNNNCYYNSTKGFSGKFCTEDENCQGSLLGEDCSDDKNCQPYFSRCLHGRCQCKDDYNFDSTYSCKPKFIDQDCRDDADCSTISNAECQNFKCKCKINHINFYGINCFPLPDTSCTTNDERIVDNTTCSDGACKSHKDDIQPSNNKCLSKTLTQECKTNDDCQTIKFSYCSEQNKCTCNRNYVAVNGTECRALLGEFCSADNDCWGKNTVCQDNTCNCEKHHEANLDYQCFPSKNCARNADCYVENSICIEGKCQCKKLFAADSSNSKCQSSVLGKKCQKSEDCSTIFNSVCSPNGICICPPNYFAINNELCVPTIHSACSTDSDCYFGTFRCVDSKCQCLYGYTAISAEKCVKPNTLYSCEDVTECSDSWHWNCATNGKCVCNVNNIAINNSTCFPLLKGYCWKDSQCLAKNSVCIDYRCGCKPNHVQAASNLCVLYHEN